MACHDMAAPALPVCQSALPWVSVSLLIACRLFASLARPNYNTVIKNPFSGFFFIIHSPAPSPLPTIARFLSDFLTFLLSRYPYSLCFVPRGTCT